MNNKEWQFLSLVLLLALGLRLFRITNPVADWHAFRQADTASVSREYLKQNFEFLVPKYQDLSNIQSGLPNPQGYRMVEFPIINAMVAAITWLIPSHPIELVSRLVSVAFSLGSIVGLYQLVKHLSGQRLARVSTILMAILPYNVYYSRVALPEPAMLCCLLWSLWGFSKWLTSSQVASARQWFVFSLITLMLAILLKPFTVFMAPVYLALAWHHDRTSIWRRYWLVFFAALAIIPYLWWRRWISQFPAGIPKFDWLFNGNGIRWRPAWWRWLGYERLTKLFLGWFGLLPILANLVNWQSDWLVYGSWWLGMFIYLSVIATGNVQHDYYQVLLIPIVVISIARGYLSVTLRWPGKVTKGLATIILGCGLIASWYQIKGYYQVNHWEYIHAGAAVDRLTPSTALVIAPAFGDTQFLFQTNRRGWPIGFDIDQKIAAGATHYVTTSLDDEARELQQHYLTLEQTPEYLILDLTQPATGK